MGQAGEHSPQDVGVPAHQLGLGLHDELAQPADADQADLLRVLGAVGSLAQDRCQAVVVRPLVSPRNLHQEVLQQPSLSCHSTPKDETH